MTELNSPAPFTLETGISFAPGAHIVGLFATEARTRDLVMELKAPDHHLIQTPFGAIELFTETPETRLRLSSSGRDNLFLLKSGIDDRFGHAMPEGTPPLAWTGDLSVNVPPPNFCQTEVFSTEIIGSTYIRITVEAEGIDRFFKNGLHFRLIFRKDGAPVKSWPHIDDKGRTQWPTGVETLHNPVYTVRSIDPANNRLTFDVFIHEGGLTTTWAKAVKVGDAIGLMGPSGGWIPDAKSFVMAGDETAIPAITRILDAMPAEATGEVYIAMLDPDPTVTLTGPEGINIHWLTRESDDSTELFDIIMAFDPKAEPDTFIWFAGRKQFSRQAKKHFREKLNVGAQNSYFAGYWD